MSQSYEVQPVKKTRTRRSPAMIAELILEAERKGNAAEICRREGIAPNLFYRWRTRFKEGGIQAIGAMKRGPKTKDHEKIAMEREVKRLTQALCEQAVELTLLKKSVSSGWKDA
jgi:transposase-like protein